MIGQFGVGFYSVYLVADKVRVISKNNNDDQYIWESSADSNFKIMKDPRGNTLSRGTEITLYLKEDAYDLLSQEKLEELVRRYSEFITFPISLYKKHEEVVEVEEVEEENNENENEKKEKKSEDGVDVESEEEDKSSSTANTTPKTEKVITWEWERLNNNLAIWSRESKDVTDEEYQKFYKAICTKQETSDALDWIHFKAEGEVEFKSILYVPSDAGNLYNEYSDRKAGVRLYVRKVLIQEDFEDLLPRYLNFIKGVVDSDDLPLNVSRETLQQHKVLKVMSKKIVRKVLEMLRKLSSAADADEESSESEDDENKDKKVDEKDSEKYIKFWEQYGKSIKMGVVEDTSNRSKLAKLLRFKSSSTVDNEKFMSFDRYISKMPEWQKDIYYIAGETIDAVQKSPFLASAKAKNVEVLFLTDPIDEYAVQHLADYDGHKLVSLTKEGLKFGDEDEDIVKKRNKLYKENFKTTTKFLKDLFGNKVSKVSVAQHPLDVPCVIVSSQYGQSANMERIMRAQTFSSATERNAPSQRVLEINPRHPIIKELDTLVNDSPDEQSTKDLAHLLYDTALLASGFAQDDVEGFSQRMYRIIGKELKVSSFELEPEIDVPADEEKSDESSSSSSSEHDEF